MLKRAILNWAHWVWGWGGGGFVMIHVERICYPPLPPSTGGRGAGTSSEA